jgi:dihydropteroate synthase
MNNNQIFNKRKLINLRGELLQLTDPLVMGILNLTDDSFYDGGLYSDFYMAIGHVEKMLNDGANFIDIGAQTTKPGSFPKSPEHELSLILPVLKQIKIDFPSTFVSIDTYYSNVAKICVDEGADMINDISGGQFDENMFDIIAKLKVPYILMHTIGRPDNMQINPSYQNVVGDIIKYFAEKIEKLNLLGVSDIIIDPGFGFGKSLAHNYEILKDLNHLSFLERPIMVGLSRKSMIYKVLDSNPENSLNGTSALNMVALLKGADILRVHDVKEAVEVVKLFKMLD